MHGLLYSRTIVQEKHLQDVLRVGHQQADVAIPTPRVIVRDEYERESAAYLFNRPNGYIIYTLPDSERVPVEYDLDSDDESWLDEYTSRDRAHDGRCSHVANGHACSELTADNLEFMIDALEKHAGKTKHVTLTAQHAIRLFHERPELNEHVTSVYQHWRRRRETSTQPLLRKLREPVSETSPYAAFIYKTEEKKQPVRVLRPDHSLAAMRALRAQFQRARELLNMITRREECKLALAQHLLQIMTHQGTELRDNILEDTALFNGELQDTWLTAETDTDSLFMNGTSHKTRQPSGTLTPPHVEHVSHLSADELDVSSEDELARTDHIESRDVVPLSQLSLFNLDNDDPGWIKLINLTSSNMPSFRGRARIGRGGRLLWDRVPIIRSLNELPDLDEADTNSDKDSDTNSMLMDIS